MLIGERLVVRLTITSAVYLFPNGEQRFLVISILRLTEVSMVVRKAHPEVVLDEMDHSKGEHVH
jgi:hypothetical protein